MKIVSGLYPALTYQTVEVNNVLRRPRGNIVYRMKHDSLIHSHIPVHNESSITSALHINTSPVTENESREVQRDRLCHIGEVTHSRG